MQSEDFNCSVTNLKHNKIYQNYLLHQTRKRRKKEKDLLFRTKFIILLLPSIGCFEGANPRISFHLFLSGDVLNSTTVGGITQWCWRMDCIRLMAVNLHPMSENKQMKV